ncbi:MAG: matrixin family metalloprotease [Prosthecobacter sp.]|jgi:hypothetical protein|uniref:matrixin family metalloprotease n=1 Tax=Prosthecobacter sp. TaxID=1965333 RepID=UPI001A072328|nr:matrixin family metalloprotease [Prosthecobacter sp.]MBE2283744.1 matrixin family metalloprotease [Prosthecobacter sp.]
MSYNRARDTFYNYFNATKLGSSFLRRFLKLRQAIDKLRIVAEIQPTMKSTLSRLAPLLLIPCLLANCAYPRATEWQSRPVSYYKPGLWHKPHLTWRLNTLTPIPAHLSEPELLREIDKSFRSWEPGRVFTFSPSSGGKADIVVGFDSAPGKSWDGRLGMMADAAFPWTANRGHIYLDPSEWWTTKSFAWLGDPITAWLPYSIGNVLGLPHSDRFGSNMGKGPFSPPGKKDFESLRLLYAADSLSPTGVYGVNERSGYRFSAH